jgi:hypothetical protein
MKYLLILFALLLLPYVSNAQSIKVVAEEWHVYDDSLHDFSASGEKLVLITFDSAASKITVSHGEYITDTYEVHSIEHKEADGEPVVYWNLKDVKYLRAAVAKDIIMFINRNGNTGMALTKFTYISE